MSTLSATICNCPSTRVQRKFSRSLHPSILPISASVAHAKELATHDGSFLAIGLLTLFESACPSPYRHCRLPSVFHSSHITFLLVLLFPLRHLSPFFSFRTQPPQNPTVLLRVGLLSLPASTGMDRYDPCAFGAVRSNAPIL